MPNPVKDPNITKVPSGRGGKFVDYAKARARRDRFMEALKADPTASVASLMAGVNGPGQPGLTTSAYRQWRAKFPEFAYDVDAIRQIDPNSKNVSWTAGFAAFRKQFFGMDSSSYQLAVVDALEHGEPGSITLILLPPEHGKTTLLVDYQCFKLSQDPSFRITYASEKQMHAIKQGRRIRERMVRFGTARQFVLRFGPFEPAEGNSGQPWSNTFFNVRKKAGHDDAEYSWQAVGFGAAIAGTRTDLLIIDDMQSRKSLGQSKKMLEELRQDWLSRPGSFGRTVVIGTRVGDDDIYQALMDEVDVETGRPLVGKIVKFPAIRYDVDTNEPQYLWPERYTPENYERMRTNAGPAAWARNYQQNPRDAGEDTFSEEVITKMCNPYRLWEQPIPDYVQELAITLDPAVGGHNAFTIQGWSRDKLIVLEAHGDWGFTSYDQIWQSAEQLLEHWSRRPRADGVFVPITTFVIEDKAYQHGMLRDRQMLELQERFGFAIVPHQTGRDKNDEVVGVTGMVRSGRIGEIVIPDANEPTTQARIHPLVEELRKWRPFKRGNRLKQDKVMALWFGWLTWRRMRDTLTDPVVEHARPPQGALLPWKPMPTVHLLGGSPAPRSPFRTLQVGRR